MNAIFLSSTTLSEVDKARLAAAETSLAIAFAREVNDKLPGGVLGALKNEVGLTGVVKAIYVRPF